MLKGLKHALACVAVISSSIAPSHATTATKEIHWVGCGISRVGFNEAGTLPYRYGLNLMHNGLSTRYVQALDVVEQSGIYSPTGQ